MIFKKLLATSSVFMATLMVFTSVVFAGSYKVTADRVNVRNSSTTQSKIIGKVSTGDIVEVVEQTSTWKKIKFGGDYGWVYGSFLREVSGQETVYTNGSNINIRKGPGTGNGVVTKVGRGVKLTVLGRSNDWVNVKLDSGVEGWIYSTLVSSSASESTTKSSRGSSATSRGSSIRDKIVSLAEKYMGVRYVYGGSSPKGFDCSGFTKYVLKQYDYYVDRTAAQQSKNGYWVSKSDLLPGDLVFFNTNSNKNTIDHVGIMIDSDTMIHASSGSGKVVTSSIRSGYYNKNYITGRRVIG